MSKDLVIVGAGGHARVVIATARAAGRNVVAILDDSPDRIGGSIEGIPVHGPVLEAWAEFPSTEFLIALGSNHVRAALAEAAPGPFATLIHPFSWIAPDVEIGEGSVIFAGTVVQPGTRIGRHCILNTACSIDHDGDVESFVHLSPGVHLAGTVTVRSGAWIGIGASVIQGIEIGPCAVVGAGAAVIRDVAARTTVVGVPARPKA